MNLFNFQETLPEDIVKRGLEYEEGRRVDSYSVKEDASLLHYRTVILGSRPYDVELKIDKDSGDIVFQSCSCPFDGDVCKHVVAFMFAISDTEDDAEDIKLKNREPDAIDLLSEDEIKNYLRELILENKEIKKHFDATFAWKTAKTKNDFKAIITKAIQGLRGAVSFRNPGAVYKAMEPVQILLGQAEKALHAGRYEHGFQITQAVLEKLVPGLRTIDDSNGWIGAQISEAIHLQYLLVECAGDKALKKEMYKWFIKSAAREDFVATDCAWDFAHLAATLASPAQEGAVEELVMKMSNNGPDYDWARLYRSQRATEVMFTFYFYHKSEEDVERFINENLEVSSIREKAVRSAVEKKDYKFAITLCEEGALLGEQRNLEGEVNRWYRSLLDIYQRTADKEKIIECALYLFHHSHLEPAYYKILKEECSAEQWKSLRTSLIDTYSKRYKWFELASIFKEENEYEDLMRTLERGRQMQLIADYHPFLLPSYRERLLDLGFAIVEDLLRHFADRGHYRKAAQHIAHLKSFIGGTEIDDFKTKLIIRYPARKALIEELKRV